VARGLINPTGSEDIIDLTRAVEKSVMD